MKTRSSGINQKNQSVFKILLCTNYPILYKTEDGRDYSMDSRIVFLPFEKDLKASSKFDNRLDFILQYLQGGDFEKEKPAIAMRALCYFQKVLRNNREFATNYPLNECVVCSKTVNLTINTNNSQSPQNQIIVNVNNQTISDKNNTLLDFLRKNFEPSYEENDSLTAEQILELIRQSMPYTSGRSNEVGKAIKAVFGEGVCLSKRTDGKICYKLKQKSLPE